MGNASSGAAGESAFDLFDRWLAHREGRAEEDHDIEPPIEIVDDPLFDESFVPSHHEELALEPDVVPILALPPEPDPEPDPQPEDPGRAVFDLFNSAPVTSAPGAEESRGAVAAEPLPQAAAPEAAPAEPAAQSAPEPPPAHEPEPEQDVIPGVVEFAPRTGTRRLVALLLLVCVAATAVAAYVAYLDRTTPAIGIAAALALLTMVVWGVRAGAATAHLTVRGGQLEIVRGGGRNVFDLASHYTPIDVIGEPGDRNWRVLFHRRSMSPFVVDASMVDPAEFTRVLRHYRPTRD
ncbi:hypothetical protein FB382_000062 [Nocardioides ginsengisegetis]|uniref:Uncharacterized protein n=1 Tax=Nocardioides ginsengisegetis TaxID=661491 RepID=A0A7W3IW73_9ACTN|nr:hypothetical protein [Nocardioides ginsengisegetis]MBA8801771.1 hypothetical protein [Nocardioides ginsengisegetis]